MFDPHLELYLTLGIIAAGIFLFVKEYFSIDTTSLLIMAMFIVTGVLSPEEGFSGFIHPATMTLACMFVVSAAVFKTGIVDSMSGRIVQLAKIHYLVALLIFCTATGILSAFINDSAVVAIMIPLALMVCKETGINPAKLLLPISFAACFGGACTLIGTGTNILISSYAEKSGVGGFGMFEFTQAAVVLAGIGAVYLFFIAPFLLPNRERKQGEALPDQVAESYTAEISLLAGNPDLRRKLKETRLVRDFKVEVLALFRDGEWIQDEHAEWILQEEDVLKVLINPYQLMQLKHTRGYAIRGDRPAQRPPESEAGKPEKNGAAQETPVFEVMVPFGSDLAGKTLREMNFRNAYEASVLAIRHRKEPIRKNLSDMPLKEGDMLLVQTGNNQLARLTAEKLVFLLTQYDRKRINYRKAIPALLIAIGVVGAAALNITSILISGMIGCLLLVMLSILKPDEAYQSIDWKVIFMTAGVLSMGSALEKTGGAQIISDHLLAYSGSIDPRVTLSLIFLVTFLSTNVLSGRATAALMTPIVISLAGALQVSEKPFLVAVIFACAMTFMTPVCNPTNTMVYAPGNYRFTDYLKVGAPLNFLIWIAASFIIPLFFPF